MASQPEQPDQYACAAAWSALSAAHALVTDQLGAALTESCGLSINEFELLLQVSRADEPGLRQGLLGCSVRLTQPSLSRAVARLERHGWLRRSGAPGDGRGVLVTITPAGREVLGRGARIHAQIIRRLLLDQLNPDEQELLARALARVAERGPEAHLKPEQSWPSQPHSA
jgi:DNA-binding MarR family transcriptional regulator